MTISMLAVAVLLSHGSPMAGNTSDVMPSAGDAGEQNAPPAPGSPTAPAAPKSPQPPTAPKAPTAPRAPTAPKAPAAPKPPVAATPSAPGAPSAADPAPNTLTAEEKNAGWVLLFDGTDAGKHFRGFRKDALPEGWQVVDGMIVRKGAGGDIITREMYKDFEFVCDWMVKPGGNSGIMWHVSEEREYPWETGPEMQILDDKAHVDGRSPSTSAGACYALYPAPEGAARPAGEWNRARILVRGPKVELWLNGVQTASFDTSSAEWKEKIAASKFKAMPMFATKERGYLALQDHGDEVSFRNVKIREIE